MLKRQISRSNNGIERSKYITFGVPAEGIAARPRLDRVEADVMGSLHRLGDPSAPLDGRERLARLHGQMHPGSQALVGHREPFRFSWADIPQTGMGTKDFITPSGGFDFRQSRMFCVGQFWGAASYLQILVSELSDRLLREKQYAHDQLTIPGECGRLELRREFLFTKRSKEESDMAYNGFAIDQYLDAEEVTRQLDELIRKPVWSIRKDKLKDYVENYFNARCPGSKEMISQAKKVIPGGVQHNLAFNYPFPIVITKAEGAKLWDIDGNWYYDLLQAGGPTILGSNMPEVRGQVIDLLNTCGPSTGLFHEYEYKLAKKISDMVPSVEMFRMLGSGTEAAMCAARIARLKTGKKNILKMGGAYHGWSDQLAYGMRVPGTKGIMSKGVPNFVFKHTNEFFPNDLEDLERKLKANKLDGGTAAVYLEPIGPESGTRPLSREFVRGTARLARQYGALLIFDEVVTGFRIGPSGAQGFFGVDPDLTVFGKIIAGGYPGAGGVGGHADCMAHLGAGLDSSGKKVSKAMCGGTMAATPISCVAGYYTLCEIERTNACETAGRMGDRLTQGLQGLIRKYGLPFVAFNQGSICHLDNAGTMHFCIDWKKPWTIPEILKQTGVRQREMEHMGAAYMAEGIVTLAGSRLYTSAAYTEEMIDDVLARFDRVLANCGPLEVQP